MATNAPYYQLRGQFTTSANAQFGTDDDDYDLSSSMTPQNAALYSDAQNPDSANATLEENHNLVELLEAATTAAGEAAEAMDVERGDTDTSAQMRGKRKRESGPQPEEAGSVAVDMDPENTLSRNKRSRASVPTDPQLHRPDARPIPSSEALLSDARSAGVHSAAALFRRTPSQPAKKYTRPPMSKLFMSLQLSPENFLHLQAQAKSYMLDSERPERQSCVGNRGKGDTDMVKLRLFNCVRDFLSDGVGDRFFGENVEKPAETEAIEAARALGEEKTPSEGKLVWPRDGNKIISLVTPLLRRMVTNERQRRYAIETRKGGSKKKEGSVESTASQTHQGDFNMDGTGSHGQQLIGESQTSPEPRFITHNLTQSPARSIPPSPPTSPPVSRSYDIPHSIYPSVPMASNLFGSSSKAQASSDNIDLPPIEELRLPTTPSFHLNIVRISMATRNGIKLDIPPQSHIGNIMSYTYDTLLSKVKNNVDQAVAKYPQLRPGMRSETLRNLAVAASALDGLSEAANVSPTARFDSATDGNGELSQPQPISASQSASANNLLVDTPSLTGRPTSTGPPADDASSKALPPTPQALASPRPPSLLRSPSSELPPPLSPKHTIKVMVTHGLTTIDSADDWEAAKNDIAYSAWADGVIPVVIMFDEA
ncbi:hypothetical protein BCR34DRAFT_551743 [Clohesyomyces aquaticus]|uniref:Uncharacterized protein n=1 Tax=Clohesyomyces aquaticus TaxID=1231657 RepID=A0A1Y2ABC4_9PLEO|nr:hypothetical protein BCR34DRAFT_551743 [Clohesyomyces aquaticus]